MAEDKKTGTEQKDMLSNFFKSPEEEKRWRDLRRESVAEELVRRVARDAVEYQVKYRGCAQAAAGALINHLRPGGVKDPWTVLPGLSTLCGGMASTGKSICGALVAGLYVLGMEFGRKGFYSPGAPREGGHSDFFDANVHSGKLISQFEEHFGCLNCQEVRVKDAENFGAEFAQLITKENFGLADPKIFKMHEDGSLYDILSAEGSRTVAWVAEKTAEIIVKERGPTPWIPVDGEE